MMSPTISASSKLDAHYKINHPVLTLLSIKQSGGESKSMSSSQSMMIMTFGLKSSDTTMMDSESLMKDASKIARMICDLLDNYNTDHYPGRPSQKENTIIIPIKVTTWTGD
jgi:hypothetical protein